MRYRKKLCTIIFSVFLLAASCGVRDTPDSVYGIEEGGIGQISSDTSLTEPGSVQPSATEDDGLTAVADFHYLELDSQIGPWLEMSYTINNEWLYMTDTAVSMEEHLERDEDGEETGRAAVAEYIGITKKRIADGYQEKNYIVTTIEDKGTNKPLLLADKGGNCYIYWRLNDWEDNASTCAYILEKYNPDGILVWKKELEPDRLEGMGEMLDQGTVTGDGRVLLYSYGTEGHVFCFGADGSQEEIYVPQLDSLEGVVLGKDNRAYAYCVTAKEPIFIELGGGGAEYVCPVVPIAVYSGYEEGLMLATRSGLLRYWPETGETEQLWGWEDELVQIDGSKVDRFFQSDGTFTILSLDMIADEYVRQLVTVASITMEDSREYPKKQVLTLATDVLSTGTKTLVQMYNRSSRQYRIEVSETGNAAVLQKMLLQGEGTDLMEVGRIYMGDLVRQGAFEDLDPYYEKSQAVKQEDILESVRRACMIDGMNVTVIPGFDIKTLRARGDYMTADEWTVWKFLEMGQEQRMFSVQDPQYALRYCMGLRYGEHFIDYETGTCSFDGEEFRRILEACGRWEKYVYQDAAGSQVEGSADEGEWLFDYQWINSAWSVVQSAVSLQYDYGGDNYSDTLVGYPGWEGGEYALQAYQMYAINSASKNKDGAWDFLEYLLSEDVQSRMRQIRSVFAVREDCFEADLNDIYCDPYFTRETLPTEKDIQRVREMADAAILEDFNRAFNPVWAIVSEEAGMYFAGDSTLEETVRKIQNRVQLYLDEM